MPKHSLSDDFLYACVRSRGQQSIRMSSYRRTRFRSADLARHWHEAGLSSAERQINSRLMRGIQSVDDSGVRAAFVYEEGMLFFVVL